MRLALVSLFLLLVLAICSAATLAQPTIYILSVKESQGWWTDLQMLAAKTQDYLQRAGKALGLSFSIEVIDSIEKWDKFVAEAPPYAVIINAHGELVPVPPRYGTDWQSFFKDLAANIKYKGWVFVNPVGYGFFYVTYNYTRRPDGTWKWEFLKVDTAGLDTLGKWLGIAATAWPDPSGRVPSVTGLGKLVFDALGYSMSDTADAPRPLTTNASASWYFYVLKRGKASTYACAGFVVGKGALLWGGWADGRIEEQAKVAVAMTLYHLFPIEIKASREIPSSSPQQTSFTNLLLVAAAAIAVFIVSIAYVLRRHKESIKPQPSQQEGIQIVSHEHIGNELALLAEEAERYRGYLKRLEAIKAQGKISETTYRKLKEEYSDKLRQLEARMSRLQDAERKLRERKAS